MTNLCVRCEQTHPMDRMVMVVNVYHNGPGWIDVCTDCIRLGDRVVGPDDESDDEWGPDSAQQQMDRPQ